MRLDTGILVKEDVKLDPRGNLVYLRESLIATLTRNEFLFLYLLVKHAPAPVSKKDLMRQILHREDETGESRALDVLASRTKSRLGKVFAERIKSSRRFGWMYVSLEQSPTPQPRSGLKERFPL